MRSNGMVWYGMVWYVTWYWYEWGMVWVFHSTVWWYWYGAHLPPWNGYPLGALNQGIDVPHRQYFTLLHEFRRIPPDSHGMLEFH